MEDRRAALASQILELEQAAQHEPIDPQRTAHWHELVTELFGEDAFKYPRPRRSFRLPVGMVGQVRLGRGTFECTIVEISRIGLTLSGPVFGYVMHEDTIDLLSVSGEPTVGDMRLVLEIVRLDLERTSQPPRAATLISRDNSTEMKQRYFSECYYPCYIRYLKSLAGTPLR